jgi:glycosyltransferase involved in cell wall biosynthesis
VSLEILLVHSWPGKTGGGTVDVLGLADGLVQRGHHAVPVQSSTILRRELRLRPRAFVHLFGCVPAFAPLAATIAAKWSKRIVVWTPVLHPSRRHTWKGYGLLRSMQLFDTIAPRAAHFVDAVIAATEAEADYFRSLDASRVELIPPGVVEPSVSPCESDLANFRDRMKLNGRAVVLTVARDNRRKALPFGVKAFCQLRKSLPDTELLLVGADPDRWNGVPGVRCPGWLEPHEVELAYRSADVLFVPSLYEGLPRAVIEAWRFSLPVVATDRVALAPMIADVGGRVVAYGNVLQAASALSHLLSNRKLARTYGARGRRMVEEQFRLDLSVTRTEALYHGLLEDR